MQFPTEENIKHFLKVMDVTRRKSAAFTAAVNYVAQKNALYTREDTHPITAPGLKVMKDIRYHEIDSLIRNSRKEFALIMFTQPGCGFCNAQIDILSFFEETFGWPLRMVNIKENPAAGARFGVEQTPSIILVHKETKDYLRISSGVISLSKLKLRLYRSIRMMKNEILPEQWGTYDFEKGTGGDPLKFVDIDNRFNSPQKIKKPGMKIQQYIPFISYVVFITSVILHEISHGVTAYLCGDTTAMDAGRLSLSPIRHFDVIGSMVVPVLLFLTGSTIFGWAKPVPVNFDNLKLKKKVIVSCAGVFTNIDFSGSRIVFILQNQSIHGARSADVDTNTLYRSFSVFSH